MKKIVVFVLGLMLVTAGAFALDKTAGGGILFNAGATSGSIDMGDYDGGGTADWTMTRTGFGAFGFFGLSQFLELNLGILYKNPTELSETWNGSTTKYTGSDIADVGIEGTTALQLGVYGKYPIPINDMFVFFPTIGVDAEITFADATIETGDTFAWWSDIWLRAGVGLDVFLTEKMFLRGHLIYGAALPVGGDEALGLKIGHGFLGKLGIGWML